MGGHKIPWDRKMGKEVGSHLGSATQLVGVLSDRSLECDQRRWVAQQMGKRVACNSLSVGGEKMSERSICY